MIIKIYKVLTSIILITCLTQGCKREIPDIGKNPFDNTSKDTLSTLDTVKLDPNSIFSIHKDILLKTCANSGCHDGNFEPDFRTVESSYYSLVNTPVIKTRIDGGFEMRVKPRDADNSMLIYRLSNDLNGNSGIMPLGLEADSDYPINKDEYIQRIKSWISNGALDMYGNETIKANYPPVVKGVEVYQNQKILNRVGVYEPVNANSRGGEIEVFVSLYDKEGKLGQLENLKVGLSSRPDSFDLNSLIDLQSTTPRMSKGLFNEVVSYTLKFSFDTNKYKPLDVVWMRFFMKDGDLDIEVPSNTAMFFLKKYAAVTFVN